jgi:hypothetical protein
VALDPREFVVLRPFVYHVTDRTNVRRLQKLRCVQPAAEMLRLARQENLIRQRRMKAIQIVVNGDTVLLKDQVPLIFANAKLPADWSEEDFIAHLNEHVYFWPGGLDKPVKSGARFHNHYLGEQPAVLRVPTADLLTANDGRVPLFCPFNSGAPRKQTGAAVPRGPDLFQPSAEFARTAGKVIELVFRCTVQLPATTELSLLPGIWTILSGTAPSKGNYVLAD